MMYLLDMFLYQIRPFGIVEKRPATPEPPPDLELTASPWFAPTVTAITPTPTPIPSTSPTTPNKTEVQDSQQLLDFLLNQLRPYGIVNPNETTTTPSPNLTEAKEIIDFLQKQYLREYVMQQLERFGTVDSNKQKAVGSAAPSSSELKNTMNDNHLPNMDAKTLLLKMLHALGQTGGATNTIPS